MGETTVSILPQLIALGLWPKKDTPPVGGGFRGVILRQGTTVNGFAFPLLALPQDKQVDTDNAFDIATGIYTVPEGVTHVRASIGWFNGIATAQTASFAFGIYDVDAASTIAGASDVRYCANTGYFSDSVSYNSAFVPVTPGQRLRFRINCNNAAFNTILAGSAFTFEVI